MEFKRVRTRFAPSPTGYMHVGNLRTALYTYLTAKHEDGTFILRIEDTDQGRYVEGAVDVIYNTLRETGLVWDEGPDVGGFLESYTYLLHGHVFANAQTGNLALMMLYAANADAHAWYYLVPVGAFLAGVFASEWMRAAMSTRRRASWYHALLAAEAAVLAGIAFLPAGVPDAVVIVLVSFVCSLQFNGFRKTHGMPYATTFCTGNLRSAGEHTFLALKKRDRGEWFAALRYWAVIGVFCLGALCGAALSAWWGQKAVLFCTAVLLAAFGVLWHFIRRQAEAA